MGNGYCRCKRRVCLARPKSKKTRRCDTRRVFCTQTHQSYNTEFLWKGNRIEQNEYCLKTIRRAYIVCTICDLQNYPRHLKREEEFHVLFSRKGYLTARKTIRRTIYLLRRIVIRKKASDKASLFWAKTTCMRMITHADTNWIIQIHPYSEHHFSRARVSTLPSFFCWYLLLKHIHHVTYCDASYNICNPGKY